MDEKSHIPEDKIKKGVRPMDQENLSVSEYLYRYLTDEDLKKILSNETGKRIR